MWAQQFKKDYLKIIVWAVLICCFTIELSILDHSMLQGQQGISALSIFAVSMLIGLLPMIYGRRLLFNEESSKNSYLYYLVPTMIAILLIGLRYYDLLQTIIAQYQITYIYSDVIPTIQQQVDRFIHGQLVYQPIKFSGYSYPSGYLPANWFPFVFAALLHFDFRYIPMILFYALTIGILITYRKKINNPITSLSAIFIPYTLYLFIYYNYEIAGFSIEIIVASYYIFFILLMNSRRNILIGLAISLCLLSRYTLILWLPIYFAIQWIDDHQKDVKQIILSLLGFLSVFYIIPFFIKDPTVIIHGFFSYSSAGVGEWLHLNDSSYLPEHLSKGVGFAYFFYLIKGLSILQKIKMMQILLIGILCIYIPAIIFIYKRYQQRINKNLFLLGSFKIYLTLFFTLIHVPYLYLYTVSILASISLLFYITTLNPTENKAA